MNHPRHEPPEPGDLTRAIDLARDLALARALANDLARALDLGVKLDVTPNSGAAVWRPAGRFSVRLTRWAARLLPPLDQPLYRELYHSELTDLAQGPYPHRAQIAYTTR